VRSEPSRDCGSGGAERGTSVDPSESALGDGDWKLMFPSESSARAILEECFAGHGDVAEALDVSS
jgi:hypothetical protein